MATGVKKKINRDLQTALTPEFRVSYPHVFKAQSPNPKDKAKFSITMLFPKDTDLSAIKEAIKQAKIAEYGPKENWPKDLQSPVSDGNTHLEKETGEIKEGYEDHWVIKASSNEDQKPGVVDENVDPIIDPASFYPGCYARAHVLALAWEYMGKKGVMLILDHVQKLRDGKPFGGKKQASQVFAKVGTGKSKDFGDDETNEQADF